MFSAEKKWKRQEQAFNPTYATFEEERSRLEQAGERHQFPDPSECFEENPRAGLICQYSYFMLTSVSSTQLRKASPSRGNRSLLQPPMSQNKVLAWCPFSPLIHYTQGPSLIRELKASPNVPKSPFEVASSSDSDQKTFVPIKWPRKFDKWPVANSDMNEKEQYAHVTFV